MAGDAGPKPDSPMPESIQIQTYIPHQEDKGMNLSGHVKTQKLDHKWELIDNDPHFTRVMRYYRPADYWTWAKFTIGVPVAFGGMMLFWKTPRALGTPLIGAKYWRITSGLGFVAGFLTSYQDSSKRFWGWTENEREVKMDMEEMVGKLRRGEPLYGRSEMDLYHQQLSASQSRFAQLKFHIFPFFNFANHTQHGVDIEKYIQAWPEEEREKVRQENQERMGRLREALKEAAESGNVKFGESPKE